MRGFYLPRLVDGRLADLFEQLPALMITGPRAAGKTTTAARLAPNTVRLDQPNEAAVFEGDPDAALRAIPEPVLIDEWQMVPSVLGAVKRAVDADFRPGRFILTGSVRARTDPAGWPGTGRVVELAMSGLSEREISGTLDAPTFLDRVADSDFAGFTRIEDAPDLVSYVKLALRSGFPEAVLDLDGDAHTAWLRGYLSHVIIRDVEALGHSRDPELLRRYFEAMALNTAGVVESKTLYDAAGITARTADVYDGLLQDLLVVEQLPAWTSNRLKRLIRTSKRYLVEPALLAPALRIDAPGVLRDANLLGRLLDTFVLAQLRAELPVSATEPRLYHLRDAGGRHEVDILAELAGFKVVAIEVKAAATVKPEAARHLRWLRDELGDRFVRGVVLHTGAWTYEMDDRIVAAPICALWA